MQFSISATGDITIGLEKEILIGENLHFLIGKRKTVNQMVHWERIIAACIISPGGATARGRGMNLQSCYNSISAREWKLSNLDGYAGQKYMGTR